MCRCAFHLFLCGSCLSRALRDTVCGYRVEDVVHEVRVEHVVRAVDEVFGERAVCQVLVVDDVHAVWVARMQTEEHLSCMMWV